MVAVLAVSGTVVNSEYAKVVEVVSYCQKIQQANLLLSSYSVKLYKSSFSVKLTCGTTATLNILLEMEALGPFLTLSDATVFV